MPLPTMLILGGVFLLVAALYSSVGHAGASGYLAAMALMGVAPEIMKPTSLTLNILVAAITSVQFARAGHFSFRLFWPFAVASIPAAFAGGRIDLPGEYFKPLIGIMLLFSAWRLVMNGPRKAEASAKPPRIAVALGAGALIGFVAGLTGTGGGIFLSPLILLCGWADPRRTGAVSAVFILVNSLAGILGLLSRVGSLPPAVPAWGGAVIVGGLVGSYLGSSRLSPLVLRRLLAVVLVVAGTKLIFAW
jgi:hypothetical protein